MPIAMRILESGLLKKGFTKTNKSHKVLYYVTEDGVKTSILTHYSHGAAGKVVADRLIGAMARQCKITSKQFRELVDCSLTRQGYERLLLKKGILEQKDISSDNDP